MSGHSHAKKIRREKEITDKKRGQIFSKLSREISIAAKEGVDPSFNSKLRLSIEKAKGVGMPNENVERAVKRGTGEISGEKLEEIVFEAYGPGKTAVIIEGITDNKNRTLGEIKQILNQNNGKLANEGSVKWLFEKKGCIVINMNEFLVPTLSRTLDGIGADENKYQIGTSSSTSRTNIKNEELELLGIEAGAEDFRRHNDTLDIYTKIEELEQVKKNLEVRGIKIESASLDWVAKNPIQPSEKDKESCQKLFEALDENDAVQEIYSNLLP